MSSETFFKNDIANGLQEILDDLESGDTERLNLAKRSLNGIMFLIQKAPEFQITVFDSDYQDLAGRGGLVPRGKKGC